MSFDEIDEVLEVKAAIEKREFINQLKIAYYTAIMIRAKDPQTVYNSIIKELNKKEMTDNEMEQIARNLTLMFGGEIKKGVML